MLLIITERNSVSAKIRFSQLTGTIQSSEFESIHPVVLERLGLIEQSHAQHWVWNCFSSMHVSNQAEDFVKKAFNDSSMMTLAAFDAKLNAEPWHTNKPKIPGV